MVVLNFAPHFSATTLLQASDPALTAMWSKASSMRRWLLKCKAEEGTDVAEVISSVVAKAQFLLKFN